ncbi:hypothetical protein N7470_000214 [Penicillium chermesinum]|nr:hypothetical protein N7470_000214 [Penicillium chermesinum]
MTNTCYEMPGQMIPTPSTEAELDRSPDTVVVKEADWELPWREQAQITATLGLGYSLVGVILDFFIITLLCLIGVLSLYALVFGVIFLDFLIFVLGNIRLFGKLPGNQKTYFQRH